MNDSLHSKLLLVRRVAAAAFLTSGSIVGVTLFIGLAVRPDAPDWILSLSLPGMIAMYFGLIVCALAAAIWCVCFLMTRNSSALS